MNCDEKICAVIPAYREAARIGAVVRGVRAQGLAVVVVDDGSPDVTAAEAEAAGATVLRHAVNRGKGVALHTAYTWARAHNFNSVVTLDGDGQHDPADITALLAVASATGADVVVGNRMAETTTMPLVRRWTNRFMSWLLGCVMRQRVPDTQCGFRYYRLDALPATPPPATRFAAESEILLDMTERGARIAAAPVRTIYRDEKSKINPVVDTLRFFGMMLRRLTRKKRD